MCVCVCVCCLHWRINVFIHSGLEPIGCSSQILYAAGFLQELTLEHAGAGQFHCKRKIRNARCLYFEYRILNFSMHNSTSIQNVLILSAFWVLMHIEIEYYHTHLGTMRILSITYTYFGMHKYSKCT